MTATSTDDDLVEVIVSARQEIQFSQRRKIPRALLQKYDEMCEAKKICDEDFNREFGHLIDEQDVLDADEFEDLEITPVKRPAWQPFSSWRR